MGYQHIGNVPENYRHEPRYVAALGLVVTPELALKFYLMMKLTTSSAAILETTDAAQGVLETEIKQGRIAPHIGTGFVIFSEDMLNVARWDSKHPIVLKNDIYTYEKSDIQTAQFADIRETGGFCIWELGIVNHERDAWKRYLASKHTNKDKKRYLDDFIEGKFT